jgi:diaminopimelate decarboxylase
LHKRKVKCASGTRFGVRVNPRIGAGSIGATSTAAAGGKFGIELVNGATEELIKAFKEN